MKHFLVACYLALIANTAFGQETTGELTTTIRFLFEGRAYGDEPDAGVVWEKDENDAYTLQSGWLSLPNCALGAQQDGKPARIELSAAAAKRLLTILKYYKPSDAGESSRVLPTKKPSAVWNPSVPAMDADGGYFLKRFTEVATRMSRSDGRAYYVFEDSGGDFAVAVQVGDRTTKELLGTRPALWGTIKYTEQDAPQLLSFVYPEAVFSKIETATATLGVGKEGAVFQGPSSTAILRLVKKEADTWVVQSSSLDLDRVTYPTAWGRHVGIGDLDPKNIVSQMALEYRSWWDNDHRLDPEVLVELWKSQ